MDYESLPSDTTLLTHLGAGAAAGILEHSIMYPFDCVKVSNFCSCVLNIGFLQKQQSPRHACTFSVRIIPAGSCRFCR